MTRKYTKKEVEHFLKEHIIRGDASDGIPNFLSDDSDLVDGKKQSPIYTKNLVNWINQSPTEFCDDRTLKNYSRNQMIIDFNHIPQDIKNNIINEYKNQSGKDTTKLFNYFISKKLKHLIKDIRDFF